MALINCPECNNQVSDTATACPHCGAPVGSESHAAGAALVTTQETSKKLKLHIILSLIFFWIGITGSIVVAKSQSTEYPINTSFFFWLLGIGITWYLYTKFKIWWHHK